MNLGEACFRMLGRTAFCVHVSFSPSMQLLGAIAGLVCILCYYRFGKRKVGYGDTSSRVSNERVKTRVGRKYRRNS